MGFIDCDSHLLKVCRDMGLAAKTKTTTSARRWLRSKRPQ